MQHKCILRLRDSWGTSYAKLSGGGYICTQEPTRATKFPDREKAQDVMKELKLDVNFWAIEEYQS